MSTLNSDIDDDDINSITDLGYDSDPEKTVEFDPYYDIELENRIKAADSFIYLFSVCSLVFLVTVVITKGS